MKQMLRNHNMNTSKGWEKGGGTNQVHSFESGPSCSTENGKQKR